MDGRSSFKMHPASAEDILTVLSAFARQRMQIQGKVERPRQLPLEMSVSQIREILWPDEIILVSEASTGKLLAMLFEVDIDEKSLELHTEPETKKTVADICQLLSNKVLLPHLRPLNVLGEESIAASLFFAFRALLAEQDAKTVGLRPSSPVKPMLNTTSSGFFMHAAKLAPRSTLPMEGQERPGIHYGIAMIASGATVVFLALLTVFLLFVVYLSTFVFLDGESVWNFFDFLIDLPSEDPTIWLSIWLLGMSLISIPVGWIAAEVSMRSTIRRGLTRNELYMSDIKTYRDLIAFFLNE